MKTIFIILDGLGDRPIKEFGGKTPLEAAKKPNLDYLAKSGLCGKVSPFLFPNEKTPTSEGAHIGLFGYQDYFLGRGPYEAAGIGMKMEKGDIAFRVNFATVDENLKITDRRAGRISETESLIKSLEGIEIEGVYPVKSFAESKRKSPILFNRVKFLLFKSYGHRAGLVMRGKNLSEKINSNDPKATGETPLKIFPQDRSEQAKFTADILEKFLEKSHRILKDHPLNKKRKAKGLPAANYLLVRGAGKFKETPSFYEKYGLKACCIAGGGLYKGIAKILGMNLINVKGATGLVSTNLKGKFLAAKNAVKKYDFVFLHIKAADTFGEDGDFEGKKRFIEKIDKNLKNLFDKNPKKSAADVLIVITADHSTPCPLKSHSTDPVPILMAGDKIKAGAISEFSERKCEKGELGEIKGSDLLRKILSTLNYEISS